MDQAGSVDPQVEPHLRQLVPDFVDWVLSPFMYKIVFPHLGFSFRPTTSKTEQLVSNQSLYRLIAITQRT